MAAPVLQAATGGSTSATTSHSMSLPASITAGEMLLLIIQGSDDTVTWTTPTGWDGQILNNSTGGFHRTVAFYKLSASGSEGATVSVTSSGNTDSAYTSYRVSGHDTSTAPEANSSSTSETATPNPPSLTPAWGSAATLWIAGCTISGSQTLDSYSSGYSGGRKDGTGTRFVASAYLQSTVSSEDPGTLSFSGGAPAVRPFTIGIKPAPVTTTTTETFTLTETTSALRGPVTTTLETITLSEPVTRVNRGTTTTIFDTITASDTITMLLRWIRQVRNSSVFSLTSKSSESWTNETQHDASFTNDTKTS